MTEPPRSRAPSTALPGECDQDALAAFLEEHDELQDKIYAYVRRRIPDDHSTADAFTDTILSFVAYADRTSLPEEDYLSVIFGVARRKIADYWRKQSRKNQHEMPCEPSETVLLANSVVDPYAGVDCRVDVQKALDRLTSRQREVLVLRFLDQLTVDEVAAVIGVSASAVKKISTVAIEKLLLHGNLKNYRQTPAGGSPKTERRRHKYDIR